MRAINCKGALWVLIALSVFLYSNLSRANISFTQQVEEPAQNTLNPVNEVSSGSIIYYLPNSAYLTQVALDTKVQMDITGTINRVRVEQTFTNPSNEWAEGVYVFPLPEDSAVDHLTMHIGDRIIEGQIKERQQAKKIYEQAKQEGKKASLVEQQRPNIFTTSVANIPPGESITIAIEYQQAVLIDNEKFSIRFPMVIGDRYVPGIAITTPHDAFGQVPNTHRVKDASKVTPPSTPFVDRPVNITINLKAGFATASIDSSYHRVDIRDIDSLTKQIVLLDSNAQAERDFELVWQALKTLQPELAVFTQQKGDDYYLMLMATPPRAEVFKTNNTPREVIFIIDSSGSMSGSSMNQARAALAQAIVELKPTDRFNVIDFDSSFTPLFIGAMPAIQANKMHGIAFTNSLVADSGTEPLEAIKFAFTSRSNSSANYLRQIIFLTDGQVSNEYEILLTVSRYIDRDRLFTIGIGSAPNSYLMTKLADYGRGAFVHIGSIEEVESKMLELFNKLTSPALTNINITLPQEISSEQARAVIPDLYAGETIVAVFKMNELPGKLSITGNTIDGAFLKGVVITQSNNTKGIDVLWARRKIAGLMDEYRQMYSGEERDDIQEKITNLALDYHLVSRFTSLVAVDTSPSRPGEEQLVSKAVIKKVKAPQTATNSSLWMIIGLLLIFFAFVFHRRRAV
jgi:Ca-activated chloride channel family protein